jgi:hypothetical protein
VPLIMRPLLCFVPLVLHLNQYGTLQRRVVHLRSSQNRKIQRGEKEGREREKTDFLSALTFGQSSKPPVRLTSFTTTNARPFVLLGVGAPSALFAFDIYAKFTPRG